MKKNIFKTLNVLGYFYLLALAACSIDSVPSSDVNQNSIYQHYTLSIDESTNSSTLGATFRVGGFSGTTVDLQKPSAVYLNGQVGSKNGWFGTSYEHSQAGYVSVAQFEWRDDSNRVFKNEIYLSPMTVSDVNQNLDINFGYDIKVTTQPLESSETIEATINQESSQDGTAGYAYATGVFNQALGKIIFPKQELYKLHNGKAKLTVYKKKTLSLQQKVKAGGIMTATFNTRSYELVVVGQNAPVMITTK